MRLKAWIVAVLLAVSAAGCGGDDDGESGGDQHRGSDAPRNASVEDFCATFEETSLISGADAAKRLAETGTPADIPDDARRGFEYLIDHPEGGQAVATNEDVAAYVTYGSKTCADLINE